MSQPRDVKDRGSKWLIEHHGGAILRLAGTTGFTACRAAAAEVVAPKSVPDGLFEVHFPGRDKPDLFLLEVSAYPARAVEEQLAKAALLVLVDRGALPEVIALVLHPKGDYRLPEEQTTYSRHGHTSLLLKWTVVELWSIPAQRLLDLNDVGVIPYVPLAQFSEPPEVVLDWCRRRIDEQAPADQRTNLLAITRVMAEKRFKGSPALEGLIRREDMLELPAFLEFATEITQKNILAFLKARFGPVPADLADRVRAITEQERLDEVLARAARCRDLEEFRAGLPT